MYEFLYSWSEHVGKVYDVDLANMFTLQLYKNSSYINRCLFRYILWYCTSVLCRWAACAQKSGQMGEADVGSV